VARGPIGELVAQGPAVRPCGFSSDAGSCRAAVALTFRSAGQAPAKNADAKVGATLAWPCRQNHGAMEEPACSAGPRSGPAALPAMRVLAVSLAR